MSDSSWLCYLLSLLKVEASRTGGPRICSQASPTDFTLMLKASWSRWERRRVESSSAIGRHFSALTDITFEWIISTTYRSTSYKSTIFNEVAELIVLFIPILAVTR